jgi:hypothetical protein
MLHLVLLPLQRSSHATRRMRLVFAFLTFLLLAASNALVASTVTVTNTNDSGPGSLRQAISDAITGDTIDFNLSGCPCTITLTSAELVINKSVTIQGPGADQLTVSGNNATRVFNIATDRGNYNISVSGVTIANGRETALDAFGGGIFNSNSGTLAILNTVITDNSAVGGFDRLTNGGGNGGGLYHIGSGKVNITGSSVVKNSVLGYSVSGGGIMNAGGGILNVVDSAVVENSTNLNDGVGGFSYGTGICNQNSSLLNTARTTSTINILRSTISGNFSREIGYGAIFNAYNCALLIRDCTVAGNSGSAGRSRYGGGIHAGGVVTITGATVTGNSATQGGGVLAFAGSRVTISASTIAGNSASSGGGVYSFADGVNIISTLVALNTDSDAALDFSPDVRGDFTSAGYNLIGNPNGASGFSAAGDQTNVANPGLEIDGAGKPFLKDNGGPTETIALLIGSPAIDAGKSVGLPTDQRGIPRPYDDPFVANVSDGSDIGAFEKYTCPAITATVIGSTTICPGSSSIVSVNVTGGTRPYTVSLTNGGGTQTGIGPTFSFSVSPATTTTYDIHDGSDRSGCPVTASGSATITVTDATPPVINLNGANPLTVECHTAFTDPGASANDSCAGNVPVNASGSVNPNLPGTYTITYNASDPSGNPATAVTRTVKVIDTTVPVITLGGANPLTVECHTSFTDPGADASDSCAGGVPVTVSDSVNANVPGVYTISYNATDPSGNPAAPVTRTVNVVDTTSPVITPNDANPLTVECHTAFVDPGASASDSCAGSVPVTVSGTVNSNVPGTYTITYNARDPSGNAAAAKTRTVKVVDTVAPTIALNGANPFIVECHNAFTDPGASASDACAGTVPLTASGSVNPNAPGTYTITYNATDPSRNAAAAKTRTVKVVDTIAPTITVKGANPATVECHTSFADPGATALDGCAGIIPVTPSGSVNPNVPGSYIITYMATDGINQTTKTRTVSVVDTSAPTLTLKPAIAVWPPNHKYTTITTNQMVQSVSDNCNTSLGIDAVVIEKVTSDEPDDAAGDGDGNTTKDIVIAADCKSVALQSERDGTKNGRVYSIMLRVKDTPGNVTKKEFRVTVPPNQSGVAAVQDATALTIAGGCP